MQDRMISSLTSLCGSLLVVHIILAGCTFVLRNSPGDLYRTIITRSIPVGPTVILEPTEGPPVTLNSHEASIGSNSSTSELDELPIYDRSVGIAELFGPNETTTVNKHFDTALLNNPVQIDAISNSLRSESAFDDSLMGTASPNYDAGKLEYRLPLEMEVDDWETVSVRIYGPIYKKHLDNFAATFGVKPIDVNTSMTASVVSQNHPKAFTIEAEDTLHRGTQFVPKDGYAEWDWMVSPTTDSSGTESLHVSESEVFNFKLPDGSPELREINVDDVAISIRRRPRLKTFGAWISENWKVLIQYTIPSGGLATLMIFALRLVKSIKEKTNTTSELEESLKAE